MIGSLNSTLAVVSPQSATIFWYVVRGSGFVVFLLLSSAVILGLLMSLRWRTDAWPRIITEELHKYIILVAGIFLVLHIVSTLLDSFVHFQLYQVLLPFTSGYRPFWLSLGIVSMYLGAALAGSIYLRKYIGYRAWRTFHYGGFLAWTLALTHSITTGTDTRAPWALAIYGGSALIVAGIIAVRFGGVPIPLGQPPHFRPNVVKWLGAGLALAAVLVAIGPLRPGWAAWAGTPKLHIGTKAIGAAVVPTSSFQESVTGKATPDSSNTNLGDGAVLLHLGLTAHGRQPLNLSYGLLLQQGPGGAQFIRGVFSLAPPNLSWNCSGSATLASANSLTSTCRLPGSHTLQLSLQFNIDQSGSVSGELSATPAGTQPGTGSTPGQAGTNGV
jgi:hypothetical protein